MSPPVFQSAASLGYCSTSVRNLVNPWSYSVVKFSIIKTSGCFSILHHKIQHAGDRSPDFPPVDDQIDHAVLQQKLAALKSFWQFLSDRLLNDTRTREPYQG